MNKEEIEEIETLEIDFKDTDELELALEVSSKKAIYLIDDLIKHLFELQQENQELKLELSGYRQAILEDKDMLGLKEESEALKKQLEELQEEKQEWINLLDMFKNQQKEFIEYLENMLDNENDIFSVVRVKDVLSNYEEIIGSEVNEDRSKNN